MHCCESGEQMRPYEQGDDAAPCLVQRSAGIRLRRRGDDSEVAPIDVYSASQLRSLRIFSPIRSQCEYHSKFRTRQRR